MFRAISGVPSLPSTEAARGSLCADSGSMVSRILRLEIFVWSARWNWFGANSGSQWGSSVQHSRTYLAQQRIDHPGATGSRGVPTA